MAEPNKERRNRELHLRRGQQQAASQMYENREALSLRRRAMYEQGTYEPEQQTRHGYRPLTVTEVAQIKQKGQAGYTVSEMASSLGIPDWVIARTCKTLRITPGERENVPYGSHSSHTRGARLLAAHDDGVCDEQCRIGSCRYK